jgi:hypothetical protein
MRYLKILPVLAAVMAVGLTFAAGSAQAIEFNDDAVLDASQVEDQRPGDCEGRLCLFRDIGEADLIRIVPGQYVAYGRGSRDMSRFGPAFNDQASAIWNNSNNAWCVYTDSNYDGRSVRVPPHTYTAWVGHDWNDVISSARLARGPRGLRC